MRSKRYITFLSIIFILIGMTACGYEKKEQSVSNGTQDEITGSTPTDTVPPSDNSYTEYIDTTPTPAERQTIYLWQEAWKSRVRFLYVRAALSCSEVMIMRVTP